MLRKKQVITMLSIAVVSFLVGTLFNAMTIAGDKGNPFDKIWEAIYDIEDRLDSVECDNKTGFTNTPAYDSGWVDISDKRGQYFNVTHDLNTTDVLVDIVGKQGLTEADGEHQRNLDGTGYVLERGKTYGGPSDDGAYSLVQTDDGGYALGGYTGSFGAGRSDFWLVKTDSDGNIMWIADSFKYGLAWTDSTANTITLYRGAADVYWNYVRVRIWKTNETP